MRPISSSSRTSDAANAPSIVFEHVPWHQNLRGKKVCLDLLDINPLAGKVVPKLHVDMPINVNLVALVQEKVPQFVGDGESLPGLGLRGVDTDHPVRLIPD